MLGGYPKLNKFLNNKPSHVYNNLYFLNGRSSLSYLLDKLKVTKLYLPYYICPEIIKLLKKKKIIYEFYKINKNLKPHDVKLKKNEFKLVVPYFGLIKISNKKNYIYDLSTSFFYKKKNLIWFNSLRKFFYINFGSECNILKDDTILRSKKKDTCSFKAPSSYAKFIKNEKEHYDLKKNVKKYISKDFFKLNFKKISEKRLERFHIYHKIFKKNNMLKFNFREIEGPLYYPLLIKNGFKKRKELLKKKIYTPILWNEFLKQNIKKFKFEINLSKNCLFLPVNEYLSISDIDKIINSIKNFDN